MKVCYSPYLPYETKNRTTVLNYKRDMTRIAFLLTNGNGTHKGIILNFRDGQQRAFNPYAEIPERFVADLLKKQLTIGGCCGEPSQTVNLFATEEQLESGERTWIS